MIWGYPHFLYLQSMVCHPACGMVRRPLMPARLPWALEIAGALRLTMVLPWKNGGITWFSHPDIGNRCTWPICLLYPIIILDCPNRNHSLVLELFLGWVGSIAYMGLFNIAGLRSGRISDIPFSAVRNLSLQPSAGLWSKPHGVRSANHLATGSIRDQVAQSSFSLCVCSWGKGKCCEKHRRRPIKIAVWMGKRMKAKAAKASWSRWAKPETKLCFVNYQKLLPPVHITNKVLITVVIE